MSSNKQTAVEWLQDKLNNVKPTQFCSIDTIKEWAEQAKEMEKQQSLRDYSHGVKDAITDINSVDCNRYYIKEYGKQ